MIDIKMTSGGDIEIVNGDIALTGASPEQPRDIANEMAQRAFFALKTESGDFLLHEDIGHSMTELLGLPNKVETAEAGKQKILQALQSVGITRGIAIEAWPDEVNVNKINYEIKLVFGAKQSALTFTISSILTG